ncbi:uncharacterized protein BDCG_16278 [Blastomyces dermatitidis ER-3]|uniref:Uncharacterized protein n=2 Tax=Ajellomyces dermatitidis TaxID=5039 RepID=A0A0J9ER68_AJEDA|nr:uncharacterized protein BDCG_16278 [Blastomyces dermatitidis ER-3]KMW68537.1 hypothetical protein BDDG_12880 [Blastomyces dermatitidis ATCC 18188]OAS99717.1 hypothetical protein BDCG_16278 [Blastomyces dermatitidis ER-3]
MPLLTAAIGPRSRGGSTDGSEPCCLGDRNSREKKSICKLEVETNRRDCSHLIQPCHVPSRQSIPFLVLVWKGYQFLEQGLAAWDVVKKYIFLLHMPSHLPTR